MSGTGDVISGKYCSYIPPTISRDYIRFDLLIPSYIIVSFTHTHTLDNNLHVCVCVLVSNPQNRPYDADITFLLPALKNIMIIFTEFQLTKKRN